MKDFLGNDIKVHDIIVYASSSMGLVKAEVLEVAEDRIKAQPSTASRKQVRYYDKRTGEEIDRSEHVAVPSHRKHRVTGEVISHEDYYAFEREYWRAPYGGKPPRPSNEYEYVLTEYADYVEARDGLARPVYLGRSYYIVKLGPGRIG